MARNARLNGSNISEYFCVSEIQPESRREQFHRWYAEKRTREYDLEAEAKHYCYVDVKILSLGSQKLRRASLELSSGVADIIVGNSFTLAGYTMTLFRNKYMIPNSIGILPSSSYGIAARKNSALAFKYLSYLNETSGGPAIRHAGNDLSGEVRLMINGRDTKVDGYAERDGRGIVHEVDGVIRESRRRISALTL